MSNSIQTNVASLDAQNYIRINNNFQNNTIDQLSSGYRINSSGDDAAGLATANQYAGTIATLTQGVLNANNSTNTLQIADGGISNISTILNRLQTLATESASSTFAGNRTTVNQEYQGLLTEVNRQAASINLNTGGSNNANLTTYIGGGDNAADSQVSVNLSGASNAVDSAALGIQNTSVAGGGTELSVTAANLAANPPVNLNNTAATFLAGGTQSFNFNIATAAGSTPVAISVGNGVGGAGLTGAQVVNNLNGSLAQYGISASIANDGTLEFGGSTAFTVATQNATAGNAVAAQTSTASNTANYTLNSETAINATSGGLTPGGAFVAFTGGGTGSESISFQNAGGTYNVTLAGITAANPLTGNASSLSAALGTLNTALVGTGISAVQSADGQGVSFQSTSSFNVTLTANAGTGAGNLLEGSAGTTVANASVGAVAVTQASTTASNTGNAITALAALSTAISNVGLTQGIVGAGENKLNYAINLAQSQITNFSAAESGIRDADVAAEAANLTKAQVLQQASLAALAQANSAPQAILALLKG
jgi:flagellin